MSFSAETRSARSAALVLRNGATAIATSLVLLATGPAAAATFTTFDVSDASDTYPLGINTGGSVTGIYRDSSGNFRGFVRAADGTITMFDPQGSTGTQPQSIN